MIGSGWLLETGTIVGVVVGWQAIESGGQVDNFLVSQKMV